VQSSRANEHPSRRITWQSRINIRWKFITSIMHTEGIKWNCIAQGDRQRKRERKKMLLSLPCDYRMYISTILLRPSIFLSSSRRRTGQRVARRTGGMRSTSNSDGHNPFILQNAIIAGRSRRSDSHCEDNDAASGWRVLLNHFANTAALSRSQICPRARARTRACARVIQ